MLKTAAPFRVLAFAILLGVLASVAVRGLGGAGWVLALLVLSAAIAAVAQQTLP